MSRSTQNSQPTTQASYLVTEKKVSPKHFYLGRTSNGFWISADAKKRARDFAYLKNNTKHRKTFLDFCYMLGMISRNELSKFSNPNLNVEAA